MALEVVVKEIERLSQEEGLNDGEIANIVGCSRATVNRVRLRNQIPTARLENKKDKTYVCGICNKTIYIRRKERRKFCCKECEDVESEGGSEDIS